MFAGQITASHESTLWCHQTWLGKWTIEISDFPMVFLLFYVGLKNISQVIHVWYIYTYIYPRNDPNVGKYTIHG